jgi:hypothetical protein
MLRAGVCINCAENIAAQILAQILESGPGELAVEPCSGACREAIELYSPRRQSAGARRSRDERFKKCSRRDSDLSSTQECPLLGQVLKQLFGRSAHALTNFCANAGIVLRHFQN